MPVLNQKRLNVILDLKHHEKLDALAQREHKSRSAVVRDAIDRLLAPIPDVEAQERERS